MKEKPLASLSLDLDNEWVYLKIRGDNAWKSFPSYLNVAVPRIVDFFRSRELRLTAFVVGQDAALEKNHAALRSLVSAGHEIGNHSFHHEPWLHLYSPDATEREIVSAEQHIERVVSLRPRGFRGPGFSLSAAAVEILSNRGYRYDASVLPTFVGPLARLYNLRNSHLNASERRRREMMYGNVLDGLHSNHPYFLKSNAGELLEVPVTTMPGLRLPIHVSYLMYLGGFSKWFALNYFTFALWSCRLTNTQPSLLLHALDFLGKEDSRVVSFFPGMNFNRSAKLLFLADILDIYAYNFNVITLGEHANRIWAARRQPLQLFSPA